MKEIITDVEQLKAIAEPLEFLTDVGIEPDECNNIIAELKAVIEADDNLISLAAPQIGVNKRIFCIKFDNELKFFINPVITKKSGSEIYVETFSSMPGKEIVIARPTEISVVYYTADFKYEDNKLLGFAAKVFSQMADLLDGVTPDELGLVSDIAEDGSLLEVSDEEFTEIAEFYKQYISKKIEAITSTLEEDEQTVYKKLRFTEDVINGRAQIIAEPNERPMNRAERRKAEKTAKKINKMRK